MFCFLNLINREQVPAAAKTWEAAFFPINPLQEHSITALGLKTGHTHHRCRVVHTSSSDFLAKLTLVISGSAFCILV
jgi:hypothetical protein